MTLTLELSPELEQELLAAAAAAGLSVAVLAARWLAEAAAQRQRWCFWLGIWLDLKLGDRSSGFFEPNADCD